MNPQSIPLGVKSYKWPLLCEMGSHFSRGYSDRSHFVQSLKRLHFSYSWQKKKHENKEIRSQIISLKIVEESQLLIV